MDITVVLLLMTFVVSVGALMIFVWSMSKGLFGSEPDASQIIFASGEQGKIEDPALNDHQRDAFQAAMNQGAGSVEPNADEVESRLIADQSSAGPALLCISLAVI